MTHRDGIARLSVRSALRRDAGHRKLRATLSESLAKPPFRSPIWPFGERRQGLKLHRIACALPPARTAKWTISMGHYQRPLV